MKTWNDFTEKEIMDAYQNSSNRTEFCKLLGYSKLRSDVVKKLTQKFPQLIFTEANNTFKDLTGQKFGRLVVLEYIEGTSPTSWRCKCDCGNEVIVRGANLKSGNTSSCGCLWKEKFCKNHFDDLTGKQFGNLTVLYRDESKPIGHQKPVYWICKCICGKEISVLAENLRSGNSQSCGCNRHSHGEVLIDSILQELNYNYAKEYRFNDLKVNKKLSFDFVIFNDNQQVICAIEYQGLQHYKAIEMFGGVEQFKKQQEYDQKKRDYCKQHNIILIEIPYTDYKKLNKKYIKEKLDWIYR